MLAAATVRLRDAGIDAPHHDASVLLQEILHTNAGGLLARMGERVHDADRARFDTLVGRRASREPLQHVVGHWPFLELELKVDARALIPRPETEDLALLARQRVAADRPALVADIGTGTGCLALSLAHARPLAHVVAVDVSADALALARENARTLELEARVAFVRGDLVSALAGPFDVIVANLPYVREDEFAALEPEVRDHDPGQALVAAEDGLALIRRLIAHAPLAPGGALLLEMAPDQTAVVARELSNAGWRDVEIVKDHLGRARIVTAIA